MSSPLFIQGPRVHWYRPITLDQLLTLRHNFSSHKEKRESQIVAGSVTVGKL